MIRIIPRLDIKGPNLVKGIHLEGLRVLGKPEHFARYYYENGADELLYMDAVASLYERNSLLDIIERTAREVFIPLTVGGGLRSVDDIRTVLRAGADKVSLNTAVINRPKLIKEAAEAFGSSTVVVSIEALKREDGSYGAYVDYGRENTGVDVFEWAMQAVDLGAGQLMVTSIDQEGTGKGFDLDLCRAIADSVAVPVIVSGGAGNLEHIADVINGGAVDAVCLGSLLHYQFINDREYLEADFQIEGNVEFLQGRRGAERFGNVEGVTIPQIKAHIVGLGIACRAM
jgi:imidazole glycerol-phosphate synthase subunit HisF